MHAVLPCSRRPGRADRPAGVLQVLPHHQTGLCCRAGSTPARPAAAAGRRAGEAAPAAGGWWVTQPQQQHTKGGQVGCAQQGRLWRVCAWASLPCCRWGAPEAVVPALLLCMLRMQGLLQAKLPRCCPAPPAWVSGTEFADVVYYPVCVCRSTSCKPGCVRCWAAACTLMRPQPASTWRTQGET